MALLPAFSEGIERPGPHLPVVAVLFYAPAGLDWTGGWCEAMRERRRGVLVLLAVVMASIWVAAPASAHPFGDPQTVEISATDTGVRVHWKAAPDDVTTLAIALGALASDRTFVYDKNGVLVPSESDDTDGVALAKSAKFAPYLLKHIAVRAGGSSCAGTVEPPTDATAKGAVVDFDCGRRVSAAEVKVTMLRDLNDAYKTFATGPGGQRQYYAAGSDTFTWAFSSSGQAIRSGPAAAGRGRSAALQLGGVLAGVLVVVGLITLGLRRRRSVSRS